jgi:hypothetical protein
MRIIDRYAVMHNLSWPMANLPSVNAGASHVNGPCGLPSGPVGRRFENFPAL